ncbi:hypothetical protein HIM_07076 [Hirsutella minnesotensis 3608]|uniref:RED-like N-terminal domain-containing protein n=1 Tax=Hirsutella minnesotensis 3608 TaxID=1043627 RepID=A0A0F7ZNC7_9HYPO|nr:hypothetical protein HIM_07076 [Hirsutella minnesotensis 3608]
MNNDQFRKLVLANTSKGSGVKDDTSPEASASRGSKSSLGSRERASIPMTPRSVTGAQAEFARQLAERNRALQPQKKFKTSAPKGSKLATGYVDRAKDREEEAVDDREKRLAALEASLKKGEIEKETYDKLRFEIAGGSLETTHLVKGLDFKLLQRIRRGEDVYGKKKKAPEEQPEQEDVDDAFDELENKEVHAIEKTQAEKKSGQVAAFPVTTGKKRTRDQILAELKASREAAKAQKVSSLGSKFKKIGTKQQPGMRIERDSKGREVLIIVDEDGHEKRKVRKLRPEEEDGPQDNGLLMPDPKAKPLGMEVPEKYRKQQEEPEEDIDADIFGGIGDDYDPLAGMDASESDSDLDAGSDSSKSKQRVSKTGEQNADSSETADRSKSAAMPPPLKPEATPAARNYFKDSKTGLMSAEPARGPSMNDPAVMAAIKRAAALRSTAKGRDDDDNDDDDDDTKERAESMEARRQRLLQMSARDDDDIDMGFGTSRFEDEEDFDDQKVKLSVWGGDDGAGGAAKGGQAKRKRGPKKRKGDGNSAADVLRVMEQRKKSQS